MTGHRTAATLSIIATVAAASPAGAGPCGDAGEPPNYYLTMCHNSNFPWCAAQQNCYFPQPFQDQSLDDIYNPPGEVFQGTVIASSSPALVSGVFTNSFTSGSTTHVMIASAGWNCNDLVFSSTSQSAGSAAEVQLTGDAFFSTITSYDSSEGCKAPEAAEVTEASVSSNDPWLFNDSLVEGTWQAITGPVVPVTLGKAYFWETKVATRLTTHAYNGCGEQHAYASATISLQLGDLQPDGSYGPVFDLPPGVTVNALSIGLVDNYFQSMAEPCPWDCGDNDGTVGIVDFLALLAGWGTVDTPCDFDSGGVGITDFLDLLANWGPCP